MVGCRKAWHPAQMHETAFYRHCPQMRECILWVLETIAFFGYSKAVVVGCQANVS